MELSCRTNLSTPARVRFKKASFLDTAATNNIHLPFAVTLVLTSFESSIFLTSSFSLGLSPLRFTREMIQHQLLNFATFKQKT